MPSRFLRLLLPLLACLPLLANAQQQTPTPAGNLANEAVSDIDLQRYTGLWYEIAHLPLFFQRMCVADTTALYTSQADGRIAVRNRCRDDKGELRQAEAEARRTDPQRAELEVRFAPGWLSWLPMVWADYWVIALDEQYRWAMVGGADRKYLWILSRSPQLEPAVYSRLVEQARQMGYPVQDLIMTPHGTPDSTP